MQGRLIAACSTPPGRGAVSIVRLSGENALDVACGMFGLSVEQVPDRTAVYGKLTAAGLCDSAVLLCFRAPRSYTGEDTAEIQCHGSPVIVDAILREAVFRGARIAEPGEFTRRAYQNGKLDLTAAEGIIDLIDSQSEAAAKAAFQLADGALYREIERISVLLTAAAADVGAVLDYPDEAEETDVDLRPIGAALDKLIDGYPAGTAAHDGVRVTLTGTVNAGKSTLFNALLGKDRAIVTDIPGTTRDTVTDSYEYKGVRFYLTDTAGVREATDAVERLGIERSRAALRACDVAVEVSETGDFTVENAVHVVSKADLGGCDGGDLTLSAVTGNGVDKLKELLYQKVPPIGDGILLTNARQYEAAVAARRHVGFAAEALTDGTADCAASELDCALSALGEVTGVKASDAIIDAIFSRFCVGK